MKTNVGSIDRIMRLIVGAILFAAPMLNLFGLGGNSFVAYVLIVVGGILMLTSIFGICPLYRLFGVSTKAS